MGMGMESSGESGTKSINASVGGLVWIRRRNGSWWPGQIVGIHELPRNNMITPRAGTPVKLLGREDSSVDWYNLEKSKRVKSFRCGEYDDCIEKAKAARANGCRKLVKYARREDAILQALEIEGSHFGKHNPSLISRLDDDDDGDNDEQDKAGGIKKKEDCGRSSSSENNNSSALSQSGVSIEEEPMEERGQTPRFQSSNQSHNDSEDEGGKHTKGVKRKRCAERKKSRRHTMMKTSVVVSCEGTPSPCESAASDVCENGCLDSVFDVVAEENHCEGPPSKWQSKRKRNSRHINKNKQHFLGKPTNFTECPAAPQRLLPYRQSRFVVNPKYDSSAFPQRHHHMSDSSLYDVTVEVKSSYRPQHVPYVSLMTKLNGRPIVGHPVTVEVLEGNGNLVCRDALKKKPKRNCQLLKKKVRMLSSLTRGSQKQGEVATPKGPAVACVSLKVVFTRISEALNGR